MGVVGDGGRRSGNCGRRGHKGYLHLTFLDVDLWRILVKVLFTILYIIMYIRFCRKTFANFIKIY